jgi:hypothetical protein
VYEQKFGKTTKFVESNSPIDRYYKLYVAEPETKVFGGFESPSSPRTRGNFTRGNFKHFKGCPNGSMDSPREKLPSPER